MQPPAHLGSVWPPAGVIVAVAIAIATATGLSGQSPVDDPYPAPGLPAVVTVIDPGAEPRRELRYVVPADYRASARMSLAVTTITRVSGEKQVAAVPPVLFDFDLGVTGIGRDGAIDYGMTFTSVDVDDTDAPPAVVAAMRTALAGLTGVTASATVTNRGGTRAIRFDADAPPGSPVRQTLAQIRSSVDHLSIPLPEAPVGAGARWVARQIDSTDGVQVFQTTWFELVSLDGPVVTLRARFEQQARRHVLPDDGTLPELKMRLERMTGTGTGAIVIRLDELVPRSDAHIATSSTMTFTNAGRRESMLIDLRLNLSVAPES